MFDRAGLAAAAAVVSLLLGGCATPIQPPVPLQASSVSAKNSRVGVAMTPLPKVDTYLPGASCLLCLAAASVANSSLTAYAKTLPYEDLSTLKDTVAELIRKRGGEAVVISEAIKLDALPDSSAKGPNLARKDFSSLAKKYSIDKILVIDVAQLGFERTYSAYVPTGDPKGVLRGSGSLVDLKTNTLEWYQPLTVLRSSDGAWDEPPKFPGLTNAYFQAIELGKDEVLKPFKL
ncbi:MAG TPA: hypothetical protein VJO99_19945 [Burkholderiaceae bacterium]|nr:hypothetical protein [Burkholderiaceae bacterium]